MCKSLIEAAEWKTSNFYVSAQHCIDMCDRIINGDVSGEKAHRWLGWLQGCMCCFKAADFESILLLNRSWKNDSLRRGDCLT